MELIVTRPFGDYKPGDRISDPKVIEAILASDNSGNVVRVAAAQQGQKPESRG